MFNVRLRLCSVINIIRDYDHGAERIESENELKTSVGRCF